jgi:mono/diheme cytochrome c family protein
MRATMAARGAHREDRLATPLALGSLALAGPARTVVTVAALLALLSSSACRTEQTLVTPDPHLERMLKQQKRLAYQPDPLLPGGLAMQKPPEGTVPVDAVVGPSLLTSGSSDNRWADRIAVPIDRALLESGHERFDLYCATCHGILGDGVAVVAAKMSLRKPPSLHDPRILSYPPGRLFATIREGYGLMPSYAVQLSVHDAWAVVAYVRALQLARGARVSDLPAPVRARLAKEAP